MINKVNEVVRGQAIVQRHKDTADSRHRIEGLELRMGVGRDVGHAITGLDSQRLQGGGPTIAAVEELGIRQAKDTIDHGLTVGVKGARAPGKLERGKRYFHAEGGKLQHGLQ